MKKVRTKWEDIRDDLEDDCVALPEKEVIEWVNKNVVPLFTKPLFTSLIKVYDWKRQMREVCLGAPKHYRGHSFLNNLIVDGVAYKGCISCFLIVPMIIYEEEMSG